ncbi:uncharacterized protein LOC143860666 [Tasmannia lanceolata]|uniref:uncharacterized protein LOC143860666 n=1 Tax=Tasmannia lanceolata TaxID=3420 RepID=UPI004063346D
MTSSCILTEDFGKLGTDESEGIFKGDEFVHSNSRRFMPSQADEEAHQLSYLQKHLANILALLAEPLEGNEDESLVLTLERFEHLGFLIQFGENGSERNPLSQAAPLFCKFRSRHARRPCSGCTSS